MLFFKSTLFAASLVLLFIASAVKANGDPFDGVYAGIAGGYTQQTLTHHYHEQSNPNVFSIQSPGYKQDTDIKQHIGFGQLFAGYGIPLNDFFYTALETSLNFYEDSNQFNPRSPRFFIPNLVSTEVSQDYGLQLSILPGLFITEDNMLYGRLGYGYERFKTKFSVAIPFVNSFTARDNQWVSELILGIGINHPFTDNLSGRLEYNYKTSGEIKGYNGTTVVLANGTLVPLNQYSNSYHLNTNSILLSLIYNC